MDWVQVLTIVASNIILLGGMIGIVITLHLHSDSKMNAALKSISDEMKDFHGRLVAIEERRNKILER